MGLLILIPIFIFIMNFPYIVFKMISFIFNGDVAMKNMV